MRLASTTFATTITGSDDLGPEVGSAESLYTAADFWAGVPVPDATPLGLCRGFSVSYEPEGPEDQLEL